VATVESRLNAIDAGTYVYLSTVDVYGAGRTRPETSSEETTVDADALDTYSRHKYMAERLVLEKAARPLVLRCATLIGPGLRKNPVFDLLNGAPLRMTMESTMSLVHTATLGRVVQMLVASGAEGIFNVAASTPIAISDVQDAIAGELGMDPARMPVHAERISTYYDVNVERISEWMAMPTSLEALEIFLKRESTG
jgi:nucleoside-diphosphate-sugar epimerase